MVTLASTIEWLDSDGPDVTERLDLIDASWRSASTDRKVAPTAGPTATALRRWLAGPVMNDGADAIDDDVLAGVVCRL